MASSNNNSSTSIKIQEQCMVAPPPEASSHFCVFPLTFMDLIWLRFHPVEYLFFYNLHSPPSFFFHKLVPMLKTSLSFTLHHFLPLAGNIVWPSDSHKPFVQYNPGDAVSVVVAESDADFNTINSSPREASESRSFIPHLESSNSHASVLALQITLFPNRGLCIGISTHHAVLDGKSIIMFIKAWASLCQRIDDHEEKAPTLAPELEPFLNREVIKDPEDIGLFMNKLTENWSKTFPHENRDGRCLKILPFEPKLEDSVRAMFVLTREDLEKLKKRVLSKWDIVVDDDDGEESKSSMVKPPSTLSTFVLTCSYVSVCIAKAIQGVENERQKFCFVFNVDCRNRLEPPIPDTYFGNSVWSSLVDSKPKEFIKEDGVVIIARSIHNKIKSLNDRGDLKVVDESIFERFVNLASEGVEVMAVAGSNWFGVYETDFGFGKPNKVEIVSVDKGLTIDLAENKDIEKGGAQVGLVLNKNVMDLFITLFHAGLGM